MKNFFAAISISCLLFACHTNDDGGNNTSTPAQDTVPAPPKEDSATIVLRGIITPLVKNDLEMASTVKWMYITDITHQMISLKAYYSIQKEQLEKNAKSSTNKEKTAKALAYLDEMIAKASTAADVYKVQFHLAALLGNATKYDEDHTRYLGHDLTELKINYPG
ncbi:MAG: hypothetical protein JST86_14505 [Bacteroidetes bacterium]|nr:hypothetical protein [Bacteroidota bacterium]